MPHDVNSPPIEALSPFHGKLTDFFMAGAPQLIPLGNTIIYDYFKSFPTVYMHVKNSFSWTDNKTNPDAAADAAKIAAMWIGGQALMVDILLSGMAEVSTALPYIRAMVCGMALSGFTGLWNGATHGKYYEWIPRIWGENYGKTLYGMRNILAFIVGFMGTRNNVGGGPWSTGGHIGLATASAMITDPWLFSTGADYGPDNNTLGFSSGAYLKLVFLHALSLGGISKLLSTRVSPTALGVIVGALNAVFLDNKINPLLTVFFTDHYPVKNPPPHKVPPPTAGRMMSPLVSYTAY